MAKVGRPSIKTQKLYVRLPAERVTDIKALADEIGMVYTQFGGMCLWMGYKAYLRQVNPEKILSMDQLAQLGKIYEKELQSQTPTD